ncbi:SAM-dependent methyltransferase [Altererythrobacter atlanticus]|uniref:Uncharacterized protein n=1 Tax=Croceibacterium atlanticum TaxID=1267766 RepID=A0A0F7KS20_9SPHN|nr:methyltransferase domain-containing protein [Croceibacterium atlanticum]AKH41550.1 hypothetical protein WYH_00491 [Croceibacterium atlanticum]MBB5733012.1 SAM-dependent methyltransferase [Croceibacterium atlanticum]
MANVPPTIFSAQRRNAARRRIGTLQARPNAARFVLDDMIDDVIERLAFVMHEPKRALVIGDWSGRLATILGERGAQVVRADPAPSSGEERVEEERPLPFSGFDFIASLGTLDTVNDLPGALIHIRNALEPGGLAIASFAGAGSLPVLRGAMLAADGNRPAARLHPMVDVRAGAQLLQRANWADPVVDGHPLKVRYSRLQNLAEDLRAQGLGNVLASTAPPLGKAQLRLAEQAFIAQADSEGRVTETFEILTLSGRRR